MTSDNGNDNPENSTVKISHYVNTKPIGFVLYSRYYITKPTCIIMALDSRLYHCINHEDSVMKSSHLLGITLLCVISLSGCQTSKNLLNGFVGGSLNVAELPEKSSTRVQFVINDYYGMFIGSPDTKNTKVSGQTEGIVATRFVSPLFNNQDKQKISAMNLGMPKPNFEKAPYNIVERYIKPNEQIQIKYTMGSNNGSTQTNCRVSGKFVPKANTDYRITGRSNRKECYVLLEQFTKDKNGQTHLMPIKFD